MGNIYKIGLTGGVCAGKTTCLDMLKRTFRDLGYNVFVVEEQATRIINNGFSHDLLNTLDEPNLIGFNWQCMNTEMQFNAENEIMNNIINFNFDNDTILICDRTMLDGKSFETPAVWNKVLDTLEISEQEILDRYDSIIFLDTVAKGKPELCTLDNNTARRETLEEAITNNDKLLNCFNKNDNRFHYIDNSTDFEGKIGRVISYIKQDIQYKDLEINRETSNKNKDKKIIIKD